MYMLYTCKLIKNFNIFSEQLISRINSTIKSPKIGIQQILMKPQYSRRFQLKFKILNYYGYKYGPNINIRVYLNEMKVLYKKNLFTEHWYIISNLQCKKQNEVKFLKEMKYFGTFSEFVTNL